MTTAVILIVLVLLVLAGLAYFVMNRRKQEREALQERFGPEYDRAVDEQGNRRQAEHHLSEVATRRDQAEVRDLRPEERQRYNQRWSDVQAAFVDDPVVATRDADDLVGAVMRDRGYPVDDIEDRADLVAADHAELAGHYRAAHEVGRRADDATTEELRQAFVHYRELFVMLLAEPRGRHEHVEPADQVDQVDQVDQADQADEVDLTDRDRTRQAPPA
jgi:hypothetical protein